MTTPTLTPSLEDYLETIYLLQQGANEARVRDIASARDVKASSVTPALKRLSDMGYVDYTQREFIRLTDPGKRAARRVYAKHVLLFQFFRDILGMPADAAREEACGLEHSLSDEGMERIVRFFESRSLCDSKASQTCHRCVQSNFSEHNCTGCPYRKQVPHTTLDNIENDTVVTIAQIHAEGSERQTLLNMGIIPNIKLKRIKATESGAVFSLKNHELTLTNDQIKSIVVIDKEE